jgi:hypothetical protein
MSNGHSNPSSHDPFQGAIISSVSMPNFSTVSSPPAATGAEYGQQQQSRPKSTLDLASLYDQPTQPNNSIQNAISSAFGDGNSSGGSMMFPSNGHMQSSGSMNQMNGNRNQMNGNMNPMNGNNGNMNPMNGNMNQMNGNMNQMNGNMNQMNGNMNQMNGNMNQMNGNMNQMNGSMNLMNGNSEQYQNTNFSNSATGISNMMAADNNYKKNYNVGTFQQSNNNQNLNSASGWGMQGAQNGHQMATPQMNDFGLQQPMQYQQSNFNQIQQPQQQQPQQQQYQQNYNYSNQQQQQLQPAHMSQQAAYRGMVTNTVASNGPMDAFESIGSAMKNQNRGPY